MTASWIARAGRLPARQLHLLCGGLLLCAGAAVWFFALRPPLASLQALRTDEARLQANGADPGKLAAQAAALDAEALALSKRLGVALAAPARQQLAMVDALNRLAAEHGVALHGVAPAPEQTVLAFGQSGLDAGASGKYGALLDWMGAVERDAPNLSIASFEMRPAKADGQIDIKVRVAAFRPREGAP